MTFLTLASSAILSPNSCMSASRHLRGESSGSLALRQKVPIGSSSWRVIRLVRSGVQCWEIPVMVTRPWPEREKYQREKFRSWLSKSSRYTASWGRSRRSPSWRFCPDLCKDDTRRRIICSENKRRHKKRWMKWTLRRLKPLFHCSCGLSVCKYTVMWEM